MADAERDTRPANAPALRWWMRTSVRLPLLLVCLALAAAALLSNETGGSAAARSPYASCIAGAAPLAQVPLAGVAELRADLLSTIEPLARRRYSFGVLGAENVWLDDQPGRPWTLRLADGLFPAGYEMRVWADGQDIVADVFRFASPAAAASFLGLAASTRCHREGVATLAPRPAHARNLAWLNPDLARQQDVFVQRRALVFRVSVVMQPQASVAAQDRAGLGRVDALACRLPGAGCAR